MQETVFIDFQVNYDQLTTAQEQLAKSGKVDTKGFQAVQQAIDTTATDTKGLIKTFKDAAGASVKMGKSVEDAFSGGVQDALDSAGVNVKEFSDALKKANQPAITLKQELLKLTNSIAEAKVNGKAFGKEFENMIERAGELKVALASAQKEIKGTGTHTEALEHLVGSLAAAASGFELAQGAAALFGGENEDLQKTLIKVNGAMAIAEGLQGISVALSREGAITRLADVIATNAQSAAQYVYAAAVGTSTGAMKAFRIALLATGIGAIVFVLYEAAKAMGAFGDDTENAKEAQDRLRSSIELINESLDVQISRLKRLNDERIAQIESQGGKESDISQERIKNINAEIELLKQKEANSRKLASLEEAGSAEGQRLYKEANDFFYQQEALKSQIKIIEFNNDKKILEERLKKEKEFLDKRKKAIADAAKEAEAQASETDRNFIMSATDRANKEIEQEQISFDNKQEIEEQKRQEIEKTKQAAIDAVAAAAAAGEKAGEKEVDDVKKSEEEKRKELIKTANTMIDIASQIGSIFSALSDLQTSKDQAILAAKRKEVEEQLKAGVITQKQAEARQKALDKFERDARNKAAEREKKAAVFQAILAIPRAFLKGLNDGGVYLAAIYAALAAVEAGIIASKPVPKFFGGKKDKYAGPGIVADMGSEIVERDGRMYLYTKPTQTYLGANDKVYTHAETKPMLHNTRISTTIHKQTGERFDYDRLGKAIPKSSININIDKDFISESVAGALSRTNYMDRRYSSRS